MATRKHMILVDDSVDEAEFVRRALLPRFPDAELQIFRRGAEALEYLSGRGSPVGEDTSVHIVLLDLKLPGHGGHEVLRELRKRWSPGELPVVIFSSSREPSDVKEAYRLGANSYVVKPVVHEQYVEVVGFVARYWLDANELEPHETGPDHA